MNNFIMFFAVLFGGFLAQNTTIKLWQFILFLLVIRFLGKAYGY